MTLPPIVCSACGAQPLPPQAEADIGTLCLPPLLVLRRSDQHDAHDHVGGDENADDLLTAFPQVEVVDEPSWRGAVD